MYHIAIYINYYKLYEHEKGCTTKIIIMIFILMIRKVVILVNKILLPTIERIPQF